MSKPIIVHTGALPGAALPEERESLDTPEVEFILRGKCTTPAQVLEDARSLPGYTGRSATCGREPALFISR